MDFKDPSNKKKNLCAFLLSEPTDVIYPFHGTNQELVGIAFSHQGHMQEMQWLESRASFFRKV